MNIQGHGIDKAKNLPKIAKKQCNDYYEDEEPKQKGKCFRCRHCNNKYYAVVEPEWDEFGYNYWTSICPKCGTENEINDCYWR